MKQYKLKINGTPYNVTVDSIEDNIAVVSVNNTKYNVEIDGLKAKPKTPKLAQTVAVASTDHHAGVAKTSNAAPKPSSAGKSIHSPLPGVALDIKVNVGDVVKVGTPLMILEAMKMENNIDSDKEGTVKSIHINKGDSVLEGELLITLE
ncbi:MAG: biotin/lipoyl-containing protein [Rikenellaceae bacterium]